MNLKAKIHVENQKKGAEARLSARLAFLREKGMTEVATQREAAVRKLKAEIHKANYRLARIAAQEKLNADKAQAKARKLAAKNSAAETPKAEPGAEIAAKKTKKEKKAKKGSE